MTTLNMKDLLPGDYAFRSGGLVTNRYSIFDLSEVPLNGSDWLWTMPEMVAHKVLKSSVKRFEEVGVEGDLSPVDLTKLIPTSWGSEPLEWTGLVFSGPSFDVTQLEGDGWTAYMHARHLALVKYVHDRPSWEWRSHGNRTKLHIIDTSESDQRWVGSVMLTRPTSWDPYVKGMTLPGTD